MNLPTRLVAVIASAALIGVGASALGAATSDTPAKPVTTACSTKVENRNLALFEERLDKLRAGDLSDARSYFTDDATVVVHGSVPFAGTYTVQDGAYEAMLAEYWEFGPGTADPTLYADCDKVILVGPVTRTSKATGETLETTVIEIFTYTRDGKIQRDDFYWTDTAAVNEALTPD